MDYESLRTLDLACCVRRLPSPIRGQLLAHGSELFVAGGFIRACVANEVISDVDLFCRSFDYAKACATEMNRTTGAGIVQTDNAFTVKTKPVPIQYIHRWSFEDPVSAISSFDFTIARAAVWFDKDSKNWNSVCDQEFYADLAARRLVYTMPSRNEDAGGSMIRVLKFYQKGYRIPLDSLGAVIARLVGGIHKDKVGLCMADEVQRAKVLTGLLREVDPSANPDLYLVGAGHEPNQTAVVRKEG